MTPICVGIMKWIQWYNANVHGKIVWQSAQYVSALSMFLFLHTLHRSGLVLTFVSSLASLPIPLVPALDLRGVWLPTIIPLPDILPISLHSKRDLFLHYHPGGSRVCMHCSHPHKSTDLEVRQHSHFAILYSEYLPKYKLTRFFEIWTEHIFKYVEWFVIL